MGLYSGEGSAAHPGRARGIRVRLKVSLGKRPCQTVRGFAPYLVGAEQPEDRMAEPPSIFDEIDERAEARAIAAARAEIAAGKRVPRERVRECLRRLTEGENVPPPIE